MIIFRKERFDVTQIEGCVGIEQLLNGLGLGSIKVDHSECVGLYLWSGSERSCEREWGLFGDSLSLI